MTSNRLFTFDFLRLLAIVLVVLSHILRMETLDAVRGYLGIIGLGTFFFVSGYLLLINQKSSGPHGAGTFFKKRFIRIYPLYWLALILTIAVGWLLDSNLFDWRTIAVYFLGLQSVFVPRYMVEISSYWFIGTILIYYLLYPLLTHGNKISSIIFIGVPIFICLIMIRIFSGLLDGRVFEYFFVFVLGLMAARSRFFDSDYFRKWRIPSAVVAVICICIVVIFGPLMPGDLSQISLSLLFTVGLVTLFRIVLIISTIAAVYWLLSAGSLPSALKRIIAAGAFASYAVYLFHDVYYSVLGHIFDIAAPVLSNTAWTLALPILFVICYYIQLGADRLLMKQKAMRSELM